MKNIFCTLAIGDEYRRFALFLCKDLSVYGQKIVIVTDNPDSFTHCKNAVVVEHRPDTFSFHDKKIALRMGLEMAQTAIFVDADTCMHFHTDRRTVPQAFGYEFSPGIHVWRMFPDGMWDYPQVEAFARSKGMTFSRNVITYSEGLFAISNHPAASSFFEHWDIFHEEASRIGHNGAGEGTCIGIAAEASGLPRFYTTEMQESLLSDVFWHTRGLSLKMRKVHHLKFGIAEMMHGNLNFRMHCWGMR